MKKFSSLLFMLFISPPNYSAEADASPNIQIEEIEAEIQRNQSLYKRPRVVHSVPQTASYQDPANLYAEACLAKILKLGNLVTLEKPKQGSALVAFSVNQDGKITDISFIKPSESNETNNTIRQIIQRASPCGEFSAPLKRQAEELSILRQYNFIKATTN